MTKPFDAIVIGAGTNGLVAAATLAGAGRRVIVLERAEAIGGLCRMVDIAPGFSAPLISDAAWAPPAVASRFGLQKVRTTAPETSIAVAAADGAFALPTNPAAAQTVIRKYSSRDADRWPAFVARLNRLASFLGTLYETPPPDIATTSLGEIASLAGVGSRLRRLGRAEMTELLRILPMSIEDYLDDELEAEALRAAVAAGGARDIRQGPRSGATTFVLMHYLVGAPTGSVRARAWPTAGPNAMVDAVAAYIAKRGVTVRTGAEVARIAVKDDAVTGVVLANGDEISAPIVLSTAGVRQTMLALTDTTWLDPELMRDFGNIKFRGCTAFIHYALDALPASPFSEADLASIVSLSPTVESMERAYDPVKYGERSATPHVEISLPSARWRSLAPEGKHVLVARVQYVPERMTDTTSLADDVTKMVNAALPGFSGMVRHMRVTSPSELASDYGLDGGALTGGEISLDQILFMRPVPGWGRYRMPVDGLFLGGTGCHPGPGIFGGAGWLAARAALS
jgi:phytoene dehydrogenase-like protein